MIQFLAKTLAGVATCAVFVAQLGYTTTLKAESSERPNIVVILADDMGYGDLKAFNPQSKIHTPNLDALAKSGVCFVDAHAGGSTCRPSRYALMTGRFAARKGNLSDKIPTIVQGRATVASMLRENGYQTAMVGKWHLGFDRKAKKADSKDADFDYGQPITGGPFDRGFDSFFGMHASLDIQPYFYIRDQMATMPASQQVRASDSVAGDEDWNHIQGAFWRAGDVAPDFKHQEVTQRFADESCKVIESHDKQKPLFLYLALPSPHTPWLPAKEFVGKSSVGMYGDFVMTVDKVVGQVLQSLDKAGIRKDTIVMFSSDNGPVWYQKDVDRFDHQSVGPLRGCKASAWEGGHRVPFIVRWPGHVKADSRSEHTIAFSDVFATFAEVAGNANASKEFAEDSVSFMHAMLHPGETNPTESSRPPILHSAKVIRDGDWKLIDTKGSRGFNAPKNVKYSIALYNLKEDLSETNNLAEKMPEKVDELKAKIDRIIQ